MARTKKKQSFSTWNSKYIECVGIKSELKLKKKNLNPFITLLMTDDIRGLKLEYKKYCDHRFPLDKQSPDDWIESIVNEWISFSKTMKENKLFMNRLFGIKDKENWDGKMPGSQGDKRC